jgi:hypothetical protein
MALLALARFPSDPEVRRRWGCFSAALLATHGILSQAVFHPGYFAKLFIADGTMNWQGELTLLTGAVGLVLVGGLLLESSVRSVASNGGPPAFLKYAGRPVLFLAAVHLAALGYGGWFTPALWPAGLPPISMISFVLAAGAALWPARQRRGAGGES